VNGAIFGGLGEIRLMSGAKVESVPFQPPTVPDAGSTMLLMHRSGLFGSGKEEIHFLISDHPVLNLRVTGLDSSLSDFVRQAVCLP
jgi:hypothetical protein